MSTVLTDSSKLYRDDATRLKSRLFADGYLFLKGVLDPQIVSKFVTQVEVPDSFEGTYHFRTQTMIDAGDTQARSPSEEEAIRVNKEQLQTSHLSDIMSSLAQVMETVLGKHAVIIPSEGWFRVKRASSTMTHADYFFFEGDGFCQKLKDVLDSKSHNEADEKSCDWCALKSCSLTEDQVSQFKTIEMKGKPDPDFYCHTCSETYIPLYTCWIPLSNSDRSKGDSLLQCLESSHCMYGFSESAFDREDGQELPKFYKSQVADYDWKSPGQVQLGDVILFNCKTVHRAPQHMRLDQPRMSLDVRVYDFASHNPGRKRQTIKEMISFCMSLVESIFSKTQKRHDQEDVLEFWQTQATNMAFLWSMLARFSSSSSSSSSDDSWISAYKEKLEQMSRRLFETDSWSCVSPLHVLSRYWFELPIEEKWWHQATIRNDPVPPGLTDTQSCWWDEDFDDWLLRDKQNTEQEPYHDDIKLWTPDLVFTWHRLQLQELRSADINPHVLLLRQALLDWAMETITTSVVPMKLKYCKAKDGSRLTSDSEHRIYFVTHLFICVTDWGQSVERLQSRKEQTSKVEHKGEEEQKDGETACFSSAQLDLLQELLTSWLKELLDKWSAINSEVIYEIAMCLILLRAANNLQDPELDSNIQLVIDIALQTPQQILRLPKHFRSDPMISYHTAITLGFLLAVFLKYARCT